MGVGDCDAMSDLPTGFDEADREMKREYLKRLRGATLAQMIADHIGIESPRGAQFTKEQKAAILLALKEDN